jgi:hypothetical protein
MAGPTSLRGGGATEQGDEADEVRLVLGCSAHVGCSAGGADRERLEKVAPFAAYPQCSADLVEGGAGVRTMAAVMSLAVVMVAGVLAAEEQVSQATEPHRDSGRYGLSAACSSDSKWLSCEVGIRDLVFGNVLLPLQKLKASLDGTLGASVQVETHPAQGKPQRVGIAVTADGASTKPMVAKVVVQVREGEQVVQDYSLTFPVTGPTK